MPSITVSLGGVPQEAVPQLLHAKTPQICFLSVHPEECGSAYVVLLKEGTGRKGTGG